MADLSLALKSQDGLQDAIDALERFKNQSPRTLYNKLRNAREKATFTLMMKLAPKELTAIRKEFFAREDQLCLEEFLYIIQLHLLKDMPNKEKFEFMSYMYELYKEVDVNGDGDMEWEEFTTFIVQKANQLNKNNKLSSLSTYYDSSEFLDPSALVRRKNEYSHMCMIPSMNYFAAIEEHKNGVYIFNAINGKYSQTINTYSPPLCLCNIPEKNYLATSCSDMTILLTTTFDNIPSKQFQPVRIIPTIGSQMSMAWMSTNEILYSGSDNGDIYTWKLTEASPVDKLVSHKDMVMTLLALNTTNNLVSGSMDTTISVWDTYTNLELFKLRGHRKGIFGLSYNPDYRLLVSCGFDHDAMVWSPFVKSLVFRLKGHKASLIGCQCIENSPEIITADVEGVFKLWDIRNFQCVQTFSPSESSERATKKAPMHLNCFFQTSLPSKNSMQKENDAKIFAASKKFMSFDQVRIVHEATTDSTGVFWIAWNHESSVFLTCSEKNLIIWDGLLGSNTIRHNNICGNEITACCLDDRKRKIVIGDIHGRINVYNPANGVLMKECIDDVHEPVVALEYIDRTRRFVAGYANGLVRVYDESALDDCPLVKTLEEFNRHPELLNIKYNEEDKSVLSLGASNEYVRLWDIGSGKCDLEITATDNTEAIIQIGFIDDRKIVVTSDSRGNVMFWGSRTSRWAGKRLAGFINHTTYMCSLEPKLKKVFDPDEKEPPRRAFPSTNESSIIKYSGTYSNTKIKPQNSAEFVNYYSALRELAEQEALESENSWGRIFPAVSFAYDEQSKCFYTGNDQGVLRKFCLKDFLDALDSIEAALMDEDAENVSHSDLFIRASEKLGTRDYTSALHPVLNENINYLLAGSFHEHPILPNLGIKFCWHVKAHEERILNVYSTPHGVLSSSADRMVVMWSFDGRPIGELLQNIPIGVKNPSWLLKLDVIGIMDKEDAELQEILDRVDNLARSGEAPDITTIDFSGMQPGAESAEFSRSQLRQRIEKTSTILGINFSAIRSSDYDDSSTISGFSSKISNLSILSKSNPNNPVFIKSGMEALNEVKSIDSAHKEESAPLSLLQEQRQAKKKLNIADKFDQKTGIKLPSIKKRIIDKSQRIDNSTDQAADDISFISIISGASDSKNSDASLNSSKIYPENMGKKIKPSKIQVGQISKSLERLTLPTPETIQRKTVLINKCGKFSSFSALEDALGTNLKVNFNNDDKKK